ncbi:MAG: hypothetical protein RMA76_44060 [Deltaproteobacteria bacterium]|jgi:hypothetical protein
MIRYEFVQPTDELEDGQKPMTAALWLDTDRPEESVDFFYEGDVDLVVRIRDVLQESYGMRGSMNDIRARPEDLVHAIHVGRKLDDYEPRRTIDTVVWPEADEA